MMAEVLPGEIPGPPPVVPHGQDEVVSLTERAAQRDARRDSVRLTEADAGLIRALDERLTGALLRLGRTRLDVLYGKRPPVDEAATVVAAQLAEQRLRERVAETAQANGVCLDGSDGRWNFDVGTMAFTRLDGSTERTAP